MIGVKDILDKTDSYLHELPSAPVSLTAPAGAALAGWIDYTVLEAGTTTEQVKRVCAEALQYRFAAVCVNPAYVPLAVSLLRNSDVSVCSVISFPLGAHLPACKAAETNMVIGYGVTEVDMVLNVGALKSGAYELVYEDIHAVVEACRKHDVEVKVTLETCYLDRREKIIACLLTQEAGANFVKTSTGFGSNGATTQDVELMRRVVGPELGVKADGGICTLKDTLAMVHAGANRLGASTGISILREAGVHL